MVMDCLLRPVPTGLISRRPTPTAIVGRFPSSDSRGFNILNMFDRGKRLTIKKYRIGGNIGRFWDGIGRFHCRFCCKSPENRPVGTGLYTIVGISSRHTLGTFFS